MSESATEPITEQEWLESLTEPVAEDDDAATAEEGTQPGQAEGDDQAPPEVDAEALKEGAPEGVDAGEGKDAAAAAGKQPEEAAKPDAEPAAAVAADGQAPEPEIVWEPFTARADKTEIKLTGATASKDEIRIPRETWTKELQPHLADRSVWERDRNRLERDLHETREARSAAEVEAEQVLKFYKELLEKPREEQWEWFENISQNKEALLARAEAAALRTRAERAESFQTEQQRAEDYQILERAANERLDGAVAVVLNQPEFKELGITQDEFRATLASLGPEALFFEADAKFIEANPGWLVHSARDGRHFAIDWRVVAREAEREAKVYRERKEAARKIAEAQRLNESKKRDAQKAVPPTVRAGGTPVPGKADRGKPQTREEWEASLND